MSRTVMILGVGVNQVPLIERAKQVGLRVHGVSVPGPYPGIELVDEFHAVDATDTEGVLQLARRLRIDGIASTGTDVCVPTLAHVAEALGLPGVPVPVAETFSSKIRFRRFLEQAGLPGPLYAEGERWTAVASEVRRWQRPVVFKPEDSSGSRGIAVLRDWDANRAAAMFDDAQQYSRTGRVCVEEFIEGVEVTGDGFIADSAAQFVMLTHRRMNGLLVRGHCLPPNIGPADQRRVLDALAACCEALGYAAGSIDFDAIVAPQRVVMIEMAARNGGNGIPQLIQCGTGVDLMQLILSRSLDGAIEPPAPTPLRGCGTYVFGSDVGGTLAHVASLASLAEQVPEVVDLRMARAVGDRVEPLIHNANQIGYAVFRCDDADQYDTLCARIDRALELEVVAA